LHAFLAEKVGFSYPGADAPVLKNLDVGAPAGGVTAILGPNGSGKTTLLHLILGLLSPASGKMHFFGKQRGDYSSRWIKQRIALVSQNETLPFALSLMEYVLLGRAPFLGLFQTPAHRDRAIGWEALETVGMEALAHRAVPSLSAGERQLSAVARALTQEPDLLLLDEPTSHLDLANARRLVSLMRQVADEGRSVVFTTHDPNAAAAVADHVILFGRQGLVGEGDSRRMLTAERLTATYGESVTVVETSEGTLIKTL
jgi:ABC-type cobalamin/Fe3+-siderophores transport system ATPase subunit